MNKDNEGTPKVVLKRKHIIEKEEASQMPDLGERLVDRRIKVWWPQDKKFYEGVVSSYDPAKKKHLVLYIDGDEENLNLKKQCWKLIGDGLPDVEIENLLKPDAASDTSPQKRKWKPKSEPSKQTNAGLSPKRISRCGDSAGSKSADCSVLGGNKVIDCDQAKESDRLMDDDQISAGKLEADMKTGIDSARAGEHKVIEREDDKAKENDGLKDNGQISAGELEADMQTGIDSATVGEHKVDESVGDQAKENDGLKDNGQISAGELAAQLTPVTMTLSKGESPKVDIEPSGRECFKELMELGKGAENAGSLNVS